MKRRGLLIPALVLLAALACNLPFGRSPDQAPLDTDPLVVPTFAPTPTTLPVMKTPPTAGLAITPDATPVEQPLPHPVTASPPAAQTMTVYNPYAVVLVPAGDVLNLRQAPGPSQPVLATLPATATGLQLTGRQQMVNDQRWVEVSLPAGATGWVNAYYLAEQAPGADLCSDPQVTRLIADLRQALAGQDGPLLSSLVSPVHGLDLAYLHNGNTANYSPQEAGWVFQSDYLMDWGAHPASGLEVKGAFRDTALPDLLDVLNAQYETRCNSADLGGGNYTYQWPERYRNINYLVLHKPGPPGNELAWRTWIAGIEYVQSRPYLFALVHLFWEP
jgi:hypothetical protein